MPVCSAHRMDISNFRTYMFIPATRRQFLTQAIVEGRFAPDYFVFDFEDAIRDVDNQANESSLKLCARETLASFFPLPTAIAAQYFLRVNAVGEASFAADLDFLWRTRAQLPVAIIQPKIGSAADVQRFAAELERLEGRGPQRVQIIPLIECAAGIAHIDEILTASPRVAALCFGHIDYFFERGTFPIPRSVAESAELVHVMRTLIAAARRHQLPYIDGGFYYHGHADRLRRHCAWIAHAAAGAIPLGKLVMHPDQIAILQQCTTQPPAHNPLETFSFPPPPTANEQRTLARTIVQAFEQRSDPTSSVCRVDDQIIPPQMYLLARNILKREAGN